MLDNFYIVLPELSRIEQYTVLKTWIFCNNRVPEFFLMILQKIYMQDKYNIHIEDVCPFCNIACQGSYPLQNPLLLPLLSVEKSLTDYNN